jgi:hypothetical protein
MTRKEISEISERTLRKLSRGKLPMRPLSLEQKRRAQEIIDQKRQQEQEREVEHRPAMRA